MAENERLSAVPIPSATKSTPLSSDTVTRGPPSEAGVLVLEGREGDEDRADKRSEKGDADFGGGERGVLGIE
jgi:hypothetical protein